MYKTLEPIKRSKLSDTAKSELKNFIKNSDFSESTKLIPEEQLAEMLNVSRVTIRRTLSELETEGWIIRRHGQGTFVNKEALKVKVDLNELIDFSDIIYKCGYKPSHKIAYYKEMPADDEIAQAIQTDRGTPVLYVEYWLYADGKPAIVAIGWCQTDLFQVLPDQEKCENLSFFRFLRTYAGTIVTNDRIKFQSISKTRMEEILGHSTDLSCDAVFHFKSIGFNQKGKPVIYGKAFYDTDIVDFELYRKQ